MKFPVHIKINSISRNLFKLHYGKADASVRIATGSGRQLGREDGARFYDGIGRSMGPMDGDRIYDAPGRQIGRTDGMRRMLTIVYFNFFM